MSARHLIVNADDFGQSPAINRGIMAAHRGGIVTSASLMVRWDHAPEAIELARSCPRLSLGIHLDLGEWKYQAQDHEWKPLYQVVKPDDGAAALAEVRIQLSSFRALVGRDPTHIDSHQHIHRREPLRSELMAIAKARVWASEGWNVTIIVRDQEAPIAAEPHRRLLACA